MKNYKIEVYKFKLTGKYYTSVIEIEAINQFIAIDILRSYKDSDKFIYYLTGVGLDYEVPHLLL